MEVALQRPREFGADGDRSGATIAAFQVAGRQADAACDLPFKENVADREGKDFGMRNPRKSCAQMSAWSRGFIRRQRRTS